MTGSAGGSSGGAGAAIATGMGHSSWIRSVAWSPDSTKIVSGSHTTTYDNAYDNVLKLWNGTDVGAGAIATGIDHSGGAMAIAIHGPCASARSVPDTPLFFRGWQWRALWTWVLFRRHAQFARVT